LNWLWKVIYQTLSKTDIWMLLSVMCFLCVWSGRNSLTCCYCLWSTTFTGTLLSVKRRHIQTQYIC